MANAVFLLLLAVTGVLFIHPAVAGIKQKSFKDDPRRSILFDRFTSSSHGWMSISVTGVKASSTHPELDPSQLGFFLLSDETLFAAISLELPLPTDLFRNLEWSSCVLYSPYIITLFTFAHLDDEGHFNRTFPITHADEYSLFFASCTPESKVTMEVQTHIYDTNPNHCIDV
ncbi:uncharacterized protein LOC101783484 [Setaria italica]|nr:uncharacterized protein LOC101783484 [Setaria italica]